MITLFKFGTLTSTNQNFKCIRMYSESKQIYGWKSEKAKIIELSNQKYFFYELSSEICIT